MSLRNSERAWIIRLLREDLYSRVEDEAPLVMKWRSPLGWEVTIGGIPDDPILGIRRPDGSVFQEPRPMRYEELAEVLP